MATLDSAARAQVNDPDFRKLAGIVLRLSRRLTPERVAFCGKGTRDHATDALCSLTDAMVSLLCAADALDG